MGTYWSNKLFSKNSVNVQQNRTVPCRNLNGFHFVSEIWKDSKTALNARYDPFKPSLSAVQMRPDLLWLCQPMSCHFISASCYLCCFPSRRATEDGVQMTVSARLRDVPSRWERRKCQGCPTPKGEERCQRAFHIGEGNGGLLKGGFQREAEIMDYQMN